LRQSLWQINPSPVADLRQRKVHAAVRKYCAFAGAEEVEQEAKTPLFPSTAALSTDGGRFMKISLPLVASLGVCAALVGGTVSAQSPEELACAKTRAEVRADCVKFLQTHVWDDGLGTYVLKKEAAVPEGVKTRAQITAERNKFLAAHRWNDGKGMWEAVPGKPRDVASEPLECKAVRSDVQKDCVAFMKTHRWDEGTGTYVAIKK
jgi:hypothetical protein